MKKSLELFSDSIPNEIMEAIKKVLISQAKVVLIKPYNDLVSEELLKKHKPIMAPRKNRGGARASLSTALILRWEDLFLADSEIANELYVEHKRELEKLGFKAEGSKCPYAVAESLLMEAKISLIDALEYYTGISNAALSKPADKNEYIELCLNFIVPLAVNQGVLAVAVQRNSWSG